MLSPTAAVIMSQFIFKKASDFLKFFYSAASELWSSFIVFVILDWKEPIAFVAFSKAELVGNPQLSYVCGMLADSFHLRSERSLLQNVMLVPSADGT